MSWVSDILSEFSFEPFSSERHIWKNYWHLDVRNGKPDIRLAGHHPYIIKKTRTDRVRELLGIFQEKLGIYFILVETANIVVPNPNPGRQLIMPVYLDLENKDVYCFHKNKQLGQKAEYWETIAGSGYRQYTDFYESVYPVECEIYPGDPFFDTYDYEINQLIFQMLNVDMYGYTIKEGVSENVYSKLVKIPFYFNNPKEFRMKLELSGLRIGE